MSILHPAGGLELQSIKQLGRLARGEDRLSPYYAMVADAIIGLGSILFQAVLRTQPVITHSI